MIGTSFLPFENALVTFSSPQAAFSYSARGEIIDVIQGERCCMVLRIAANGFYTQMLLPKTEQGYKIAAFGSAKPVVQTTHETISIQILQYENTNDYYFTAMYTTKGDSVHFTDEKDHCFYTIAEPVENTAY